MRGHAVALVLSLAVATVSACVTDEDCSLNGVCTASAGGAARACVCDVAWMGSSCGEMRLEPAQASVKGGAYGYDPNVTSWGGNVLQLNGTYHLFVTEIADGCMLNMWQSDSLIVHAVSDTPEGPYRKVSVALLPEAHNPEVILLQDGSLALFHIGPGDGSSHRRCKDGLPVGDGPEREGLDGVSPPAGGLVGGKDALVHVAPGPDGPWKPVNTSFQCNNPAPMQHPNGTFFLVCKDHRKYLYSAPALQGPWTLVTVMPMETPGMGQWEDPFLYLDARGNWHVLMHAWDHENDYAISGHYFSRDGFNWNASSIQPYGNVAQLTDGSILRMRTREWPKLLFDAQGNPTHLFNGINTNMACPSPASSCKIRVGYDWDYTFVQPVATTARSA